MMALCFIAGLFTGSIGATLILGLCRMADDGRDD
jgi:hypothetical protein